MKKLLALVPLSVALSALACGSPASNTPPSNAPPTQGGGYPQPGYPQGYPPGYPPQAYPQAYPPPQQRPTGPVAQQPQPAPHQPVPQGQPQVQPAPQTGPFGLPFPFPFPIPGAATPTPTSAPPATGALLVPLVGTEMQKQEVAAILQELIAALPPDRQARVRGIPLAFDPNPEEINAFAGCDDRGLPFMAGTVGILDAIDGIAQTRASDELFGTQSYDAYLRFVLPRLQQGKGGAALPQGILQPQHAFDPRRLSRARELFDEIVAFAFAHELAHHYMGHTGCANGQAAGPGPNPAAIANLATRVIPLLNQPVETQADTEGTFNILNAGKARRPRTRWTERGGLMLLEFFAKLDGVPLLSPVGFLRTHPNSQGRIIWVTGTARTWAIQNPG